MCFQLRNSKSLQTTRLTTTKDTYGLPMFFSPDMPLTLVSHKDKIRARDVAL